VAALPRCVPFRQIREVIRFGLRVIYRLVAVVSSGRALRPSRVHYGVKAADRWRHSVATAFDLLGWPPERPDSFLERTQENFAFVNALCRLG
jgi:hypothetical protein